MMRLVAEMTLLAYSPLKSIEPAQKQKNNAIHMAGCVYSNFGATAGCVNIRMHLPIHKAAAGPAVSGTEMPVHIADNDRICSC